MNKNTLSKVCFANWPLLALIIPLFTNPLGSINPAESGKFLAVIAFSLLMACILLFKIFTRRKLVITYSLNWAIIVFGVVFLSIIYTFLSFSFIGSLWGSIDKFQGLLSNLVYLFIFIGFYFWFKEDSKRFNPVKYLLVLMGTFIALIGISQLFMPKDLTTNADLFVGRIYATLANPIDFGQTLIFTIIPTLILLLEHWSKSKWMRVCLVFAFIVQLLALYFSANRASLLSIGLISLIMLLRLAKQKFGRIMAIGICIAFLIGTLFWLTLDHRSSSSRMILWTGSMATLAANPWGSGLNTFYQSFAKHVDVKLYQTERLGDIPEHPHNETLNLIIEQGIWSLFLYLAILLYIASGKYADPDNAFWVKATLLAILISIQFSFLYHSQIILAVLLLAYLAATDLRGRFIQQKFLKFRYLLASFIILFIWQGSAYAVSIFRLDSYFNQTIDLVFVDETTAAETFRQRLFENIPFQTTYHTAFTFLSPNSELARNNPGFVDELLEQYRKVFGENFYFWKYRGIWLYTRGDKDLAVKAFQKSSYLAPGLISINTAWAKAAFDAEDFENASLQAEKVLFLRRDILELMENQQNLNKVEMEKLRIFMKSNPQFLEMQKIFDKTKGLQ